MFVIAVCIVQQTNMLRSYTFTHSFFLTSVAHHSALTVSLYSRFGEKKNSTALENNNNIEKKITNRTNTFFFPLSFSHSRRICVATTSTRSFAFRCDIFLCSNQRSLHTTYARPVVLYTASNAFCMWHTHRPKTQYVYLLSMLNSIEYYSKTYTHSRFSQSEKTTYIIFNLYWTLCHLRWNWCWWNSFTLFSYFIHNTTWLLRELCKL